MSMLFNNTSTKMSQSCFRTRSTNYSTVYASICECKGGIFLLDAPGGTGKTFVTKLLLAKVRQQKEIALTVASSRIAMTLLPQGRTAHSTFKLPFYASVSNSATCNITKVSDKAEVL
ncbi:uncharacterized protein LOC106871804 [Octopus bimaculoides]|uniref:uncharacterized protein LOC106871804 n=1 Tax=Octopus bimaculoides TaxID=37653 RepID=UPI00071CF220|nr:uncharacterized protein LOC106871804 [Octopus bimaculoides]|eukprot:XP_014773936.1 PREDICTED: uncharacterized protein LOC106871804 [Octopus bimaculoides]